MINLLKQCKHLINLNISYTDMMKPNPRKLLNSFVQLEELSIAMKRIWTTELGEMLINTCTNLRVTVGWVLWLIKATGIGHQRLDEHIT